MKVIYIHSHDTGRYIEPYGYGVKTPNLMRIKKRSTLFGNAFSTTPTCSPSRGALLTGMYPHQNGLYGLAHRGFSINDYENHLARVLGNAGLETVLSGEHHEARWQEEIGYDKYLIDQREHELASDKRGGDLEAAVRAADYILNSDKKDYFLSVGFFCPHREFYEPNGAINEDNVMVPNTVQNTKAARHDMAMFMTSLSYMDKCVGIVLDAIERANIDDELYLMYTTDHGIDFPDMKSTLYDGGIGVSLMIDFPENKSRGKRMDALVSQVDIFPTICDFVGLEKPKRLMGSSLMPLMQGEAERVREQIIGETNYHAEYVPGRCVRTDKYKYIKCWDECLETKINYGTFTPRGHIKEGLFDLEFDPYEKNNLINDENYKEVLNDMKKRLDAYMTETNDPLLTKGFMPAPEGMKLGKREWKEFM